MAEKLAFMLPPGRIVAGSPTFRQDKDMQGRAKDKPNWFFAVAVPKTSPGIDQNMAQIYHMAMTGYQAFPQIQQMIQGGINGGFHWKIEDGDKPQDPRRIGREGYSGCWIFKFSTTLGVPPCADQNNMVIDPALIKCGYFVDVAVSCDVNGNSDHTAGIYLNPRGVRLLAYGREIVSGPSLEQLFQSTPAVVPAGGSTVPLAPAGAAGPAGPAGFPVPAPAVAAVPAPVQAGFPAGSEAAPGFQATAFPTNPGNAVQALFPGASSIHGFGNVR